MVDSSSTFVLLALLFPCTILYSLQTLQHTYTRKDLRGVYIYIYIYIYAATPPPY